MKHFHFPVLKHCPILWIAGHPFQILLQVALNFFCPQTRLKQDSFSFLHSFFRSKSYYHTCDYIYHVFLPVGRHFRRFCCTKASRFWRVRNVTKEWWNQMMNVELKIAVCRLDMDVSENRGTPKWMVYNGKTPLKWMIWGYPYFWKYPHCANAVFFQLLP